MQLYGEHSSIEFVGSDLAPHFSGSFSIEQTSGSQNLAGLGALLELIIVFFSVSSSSFQFFIRTVQKESSFINYLLFSEFGKRNGNEA